jgi:hypothetical protein
MDIVTLGKHVRERREALGLSQVCVAKLVYPVKQFRVLKPAH